MGFDIRQEIAQGETYLGIELGSTRIKAVLIDQQHNPIASGSFAWENHYKNGIWTYPLDEVWHGLQQAYRELADEVQQTYGVPLDTVGAIGISAMMHGYLPFAADGHLLAPFRTWRNTTTAQAAAALTELFSFNIPQRWSIAHLYQAMLNGEPHVKELDFLTTLAGHVHWQLTGQKVLGVGDASGMFPVSADTCGYEPGMLSLFDEILHQKGYAFHLEDILPAVLPAGAPAGTLTEQGAALLDPSGVLQAGIPLCPPEGDAGTGMAATNSVAACTGNISAGTSVFAMAVLEHPLSAAYPEIDIVATPAGKPTAMVHCNNCTNEINAWAEIFRQAAQALGQPVDDENLFRTMFEAALAGDADCGGLLVYNYLSGEPVTGFEAGRPLFARPPESRFTFANFMRAQLYSACATLRIGMDILLQQEHIQISRMLGHGGFFKTPKAGQSIMAAAMGLPIETMETAGEGGAWGCALLAAYMANRENNQPLEDYLDHKVFADISSSNMQPSPTEQAGFDAFLAGYQKGLAIERSALENLADWSLKGKEI